MNYDGAPVIRLEVENMKQSILHHMGVNGSDLGKHIDAHIDKALFTYPWQQKVDEAVHTALNEAIGEYFRFGGGSKEIKQTVEDALNNLFKFGEVKKP